MSDHHTSFEEECNKQEAILGICAPIVIVMILATFIIYMNTHFTGKPKGSTGSEASAQSTEMHSDSTHHE